MNSNENIVTEISKETDSAPIPVGEGIGTKSLEPKETLEGSFTGYVLELYHESETPIRIHGQTYFKGWTEFFVNAEVARVVELSLDNNVLTKHCLLTFRDAQRLARWIAGYVTPNQEEGTNMTTRIIRRNVSVIYRIESVEYVNILP